MSREGLAITALQETKLNGRLDFLSSIGFYVIWKDRERDNRRGLAFILNNTAQYRFIDGDIDRWGTTLQCLGITIGSGAGELEILIMCIPSVTCCPTEYHPKINELLWSENH